MASTSARAASSSGICELLLLGVGGAVVLRTNGSFAREPPLPPRSAQRGCVLSLEDCCLALGISGAFLSVHGSNRSARGLGTRGRQCRVERAYASRRLLAGSSRLLTLFREGALAGGKVGPQRRYKPRRRRNIHRIRAPRLLRPLVAGVRASWDGACVRRLRSCGLGLRQPRLSGSGSALGIAEASEECIALFGKLSRLRLRLRGERGGLGLRAYELFLGGRSFFRRSVSRQLVLRAHTLECLHLSLGLGQFVTKRVAQTL